MLDETLALSRPDIESLISGMDPAMRRLLTQEITSLGRWDTLRFFLETQQEMATLDEIGMAAGRDSSEMLEYLGALTSLGWLSRRVSDSGETLYVLTTEREHRALLEHFHTLLQERDFRLQAFYYWTRGR